MNPTDRLETSTSGQVRYLVTIDLERGRTLKVLRQMPDGSLHEVTRRVSISKATPDPLARRGFQVSSARQTLH